MINFIAKLKENRWFLFLLFIGILVRCIWMDAIPRGLNQDEASIGYEAWSLMHYGIDRNGVHFPMHLISWGSGQNAVYAYLMMPFISLFGLNILSVRLVSLLFGIISLVYFYLFAKEISNKKIIAYIAMGLLAISPWHIIASRWAVESTLFPAFILISMYYLVLSFRKPKFFYLSAVMFAISFYVYGISYFFIPIFILFISLYILKYKKIELKTFLSGGALFGIISIPILLFLIINIFNLEPIQTPYFSIPRMTVPRFEGVSVFGANWKSLYLYFFAAITVFVTQNDYDISNCIPYFGFIYLTSGIFIVYGIYLFIKSYIFRKLRDSGYVLFLWFAISLITVLITQINLVRANVLWLPLIYSTAIGIYTIAQKRKTLLKVFIAIYAVQFVLFCGIYFSPIYKNMFANKFFYSFGDAIHYAAQFETIPIDTFYQKTNQPYIYVLFYQQINPHVFINTAKYFESNVPFKIVDSFDRYRFISKIALVKKQKLKTLTTDKIYIIEIPMFTDMVNHLENRNDFNIKKFTYYWVLVPKVKR